MKKQTVRFVLVLLLGSLPIITSGQEPARGTREQSGPVGKCPNISYDPYDAGKTIRSLAEILNKRMPSFREYEPQGFGEKEGRPIRFFIFDLVDTSNKTTSPSDCIRFEEGHIYHVAPVYLPYSLSYIVFLEKGELKIFDAINCPDSKYNIEDVVDYFQQKKSDTKDAKKIVDRLKRYRDFGVYFTMDATRLHCSSAIGP